MADEDPLAQETRRRVFDHVAANPGTHMRELQRQLEMPSGTLEYHLRVLQKEGLLALRRQGRYARYYAASQQSGREKNALALLRQEVPRRICAHLLVQPDQSHRELLAHFQLAPSTLTFHLKKLLDAQLVGAQRSGREVHYRVADPGFLAKCLADHQASFVDEVVDRFADVWLSLSAGLEGQPPMGDAETEERDAAKDPEPSPREPIG